MEFRKEKEVVREGTRALHHLTRVFTVPPVLEAWRVCPLNMLVLAGIQLLFFTAAPQFLYVVIT